MHQLHTKSMCSKNKTNKTWISKNGNVENSLRILDLCWAPETDSTNPWGSIEPRLRTTGLVLSLVLLSFIKLAIICGSSSIWDVLFFSYNDLQTHPWKIFQPVLHDWCNKCRGMCYPVCGMVHIKKTLLLIRKSSPWGGSGFPLSLSEWPFTICPTPCNRK